MKRLGLFPFILVTAVLLGAAPPIDVERRFEAIRNSPPELYAFLFRMPKGADLHNHVAGAVYAETLMAAAAEEALCINEKNASLTRACPEGAATAKGVQEDNPLLNEMIDSLSMRAFVPGKESAHDHFFAAFDKFTAARPPRPASFIAEVVRRAAEQNESYLELMALIGGDPIAALGKQAGFDGNFEGTAAKLRDAGLQDAVTALKASVDAIEESRKSLLECGEKADSAPCKVVVGYVYQVLRERPKEQVFAQILAGFTLADVDPRVVAVNLVQPEDGFISMRDYRLHMRMVDYAKQLYPKVHVTLHAGELASGLVPPEGLRFHIRDAIDTGHAERIGHGVSVMYENDAVGLLNTMRKRRIDVEINLTSNDEILGVKGADHPFPVYRKYGVPVTLSTDDEGVGRTHLTQEYQRAVLTYGLKYSDVKELVRNSVEYSFLSGASYWSDGRYRVPAKECAAGRQTKTCQSFMQTSEKARVQADLEERFKQFEGSL